MSRNHFFTALCALAALLLSISWAGCQQRASKRRIGVVPKAVAHVFWQSVHAGAVAAPLAAGVDCGKLGRAYLLTTEKLRGTLPRFVDKLPPNYLYIPLILKALPNARVVHLTRNPMDACFASFKQLFADAYPHSYDQAEMARHHARYFHLMALWRKRFGDRFLDIAYEDTARDLEPNARALIEFLGLPWEDACLEFHRQDAAVTTASAVQVRRPVHTGSIGRWRRYEAQLAVMRETLEKQGVPLGND